MNIIKKYFTNYQKFLFPDNNKTQRLKLKARRHPHTPAVNTIKMLEPRNRACWVWHSPESLPGNNLLTSKKPVTSVTAFGSVVLFVRPITLSLYVSFCVARFISSAFDWPPASAVIRQRISVAPQRQALSCVPHLLRRSSSTPQTYLHIVYIYRPNHFVKSNTIYILLKKIQKINCSYPKSLGNLTEPIETLQNNV